MSRHYKCKKERLNSIEKFISEQSINNIPTKAIILVILVFMNNFGNCYISLLESIKNERLLLSRITGVCKLSKSSHSYTMLLEPFPAAPSNCAAEDWVRF